MNKKSNILLALFILSSLLFIDCYPKKIGRGAISKKRIIILPFMDLKDIALGEMDHYPFSKIERFAEDLLISGKPGREVSGILADLMQSKLNLKITSTLDTKSITTNFKSAGIGQILDDLKKENIADYLLIGIVLKYVEREGGDFAATRPSYFASEFLIFDINSGKEIRRSFIERTQNALLDDLTQIDDFIRAQGKWLTIKDLVILSLNDEVEQINVE